MHLSLRRNRTNDIREMTEANDIGQLREGC